MGEVIRFVPKSERVRERLISEARAIYDSIFPSADPVGEERSNAPSSRAANGTTGRRKDSVVRS
jgi:hypothetical protein